MRFLRQSLTGLFLLSLTVGLLIYAVTLIQGAMADRMGQEDRRRPAREREFTVAVVTAEAETVAPVLNLFGQIESRRSLQLRAAASGAIVALADSFEEGGQVAAGQELMRIDPRDAKAALDRTEADLLDAQAEVRDADRGLILSNEDLRAATEQTTLRQRAFDRQKDLQTRGVATAASVETAELAAASARQSLVNRRVALAVAEARVDRAKTSLLRAELAQADAQRALDDTVISAEFDGTLSGVSVVAGGLVSTNEALATLIDGTALDVAFRVSTAQYARLLDDTGALRPAQVAISLDVSGVGLTSTGQISRDSAAVAEGQSGRLIFARLDSAAGMKPGDFVTVQVAEPPLDRVVRLPSKALGADGAVLVLDEEQRLASLDVELLRRQGDDVLVRARGLNGQTVVATRTPLLGAGIKVKPLTADAAIAPVSDAPATPDLVDLTDERRAKLVAFVEGNTRMPAEVRERMLTALKEPQVPARIVDRLESRMGG